MHFQLRLYSKTFEAWTYWRLMPIIYPYWHAMVYPKLSYWSKYAFTVYPLLISGSLAETSFYKSNTRYILVMFLHMAIKMFKKIEQRSTNVRTLLNLNFLIFTITSTSLRYVVLKLFQPDGGTLSSLFKHFSISGHRHSLMASSLNHLHHTCSSLEWDHTWIFFVLYPLAWAISRNLWPVATSLISFSFYWLSLIALHLWLTEMFWYCTCVLCLIISWFAL